MPKSQQFPTNPMVVRNFGKVGDREAAEAAENAEEQKLVCRGGDNDDGGLAHDFTLFDQRRQRSSAASEAQQSPNSQQLLKSRIGSPEFPRGVGDREAAEAAERAEAADE